MPDARCEVGSARGARPRFSRSVEFRARRSAAFS